MRDHLVFISYKSEDYETAVKIKTELEKWNISCWMAPESIIGGGDYASEIPNAIRNCDFFLLVYSEKTQTSRWVPRELDEAIKNDKIIMPVMIDNCTLDARFGFYLNNVQQYNAYVSFENAIEDVIADIKAYIPDADTQYIDAVTYLQMWAEAEKKYELEYI